MADLPVIVMKKCILMFVLVLCIVTSNIFCDEIQKLHQENSVLKERVKKLESELENIKNLLQQGAAPKDLKEHELKKVLKKENEELVNRVEKSEKGEGFFKNMFQSKFKVSLYGYIKFDAVYDTARINNGKIALWVESEENIGDDDDQFNMTANQTRLGLDLEAPLFEGVKTTGKIEVDFYGGGPENKPNLRLRQAYLKMNWEESDFYILAGQTWDIIGPLYPNTINFLVLCMAGNIGYRRPQLQLGKSFEIGKDSTLLFQLAFTRTIGVDNTLYPSYLDAGEDAGFPTIQSRIAISLPLLGKKKSTFGVSGHWGREEYDTTVSGNNENFETWSLNLDMSIPIMDKLSLKGELFIGKNLSSYYGGINQGVNLTKMKEISSKGGWVSLQVGPFDKWTFNVGGSMDDPEDNDLSAGDRSKNWSVFGNVFYNFTDYLIIGTEVSYWYTTYEGQEKGDAVRIQGSMIYKF